MTHVCSNCNIYYDHNNKNCPNCGIKTSESVENSLPDLKIRNSQTKFVKRAKIAAFLALFLILFTVPEKSPLSGIWFITLIGIFILISALIIAAIFNSRKKKLGSLLSGEKILVSWRLDEELKELYSNQLFQLEKSKNKIIFIVTSALIIVVFGTITALIDDGKGFMLIIMLSLIAVLAAFAFGMPLYYKNRNMKGDGWVIFGNKFVYINGFFHNWDFPLSGLNKAKVIYKPFYGLLIEYYYTDKTLTHSEVLRIPAPKNIKVQNIITLLKK